MTYTQSAEGARLTSGPLLASALFREKLEMSGTMTQPVSLEGTGADCNGCRPAQKRGEAAAKVAAQTDCSTRTVYYSAAYCRALECLESADPDFGVEYSRHLFKHRPSMQAVIAMATYSADAIRGFIANLRAGRKWDDDGGTPSELKMLLPIRKALQSLQRRVNDYTAARDEDEEVTRTKDLLEFLADHIEDWHERALERDAQMTSRSRLRGAKLPMYRLTAVCPLLAGPSRR